jgi:hypothetical protein
LNTFCIKDIDPKRANKTTSVWPGLEYNKKQIELLGTVRNIYFPLEKSIEKYPVGSTYY